MSEKTQTLTPMLAQYMEIKRAHPDSLLFYRMGDFYEMFFEDALIAAPVLEVQLTSRDRSAQNPIPMCGVPYHAVTQYMQRLLAKGFKVALCEQVEDPATAKGLVKREVVRVLTPSLIGDPDLISADTRNLLMSLHENTEGILEVAVLDLLGGTLRAGKLISKNQLVDLLCELSPREALISDALEDASWWREIRRLFPQLTVTRRPAYFKNPAGAVPGQLPLSALKDYLRETQKVESIPYLSAPEPLFAAESVVLDATTLTSLEILKGPEPRGNSLYEILDSAQTPMGRRELRDWLSRPLGDLAAIEDRHTAVAALLAKPSATDKLRYLLAKIRDLERLSSKTALGLAMPRDLAAIRDILKLVPEIKKAIPSASSPLLKKLSLNLSPSTPLTELLEKALENDPPATLRDGGIIRESFHPEVAELRGLSRDAKGSIATMETREKERTGISSLKIKYSKVFGYTIEITHSHLKKVPPDYIRKQTIANGERYITQELKVFEEKSITAEFKLRQLEDALFTDLRRQVAAHATELLGNARTLAALDVLLCFAKVAGDRGYCKPQMSAGGELHITDGRHPVVETLLPPGQFVPNSIAFSPSECQTWIITGPNMAGKSTIMRQVALICLLAQAGSFVPAAQARLPVLDAIFTRIGSSDDLSRGRSTFMVEMTELNRILERATDRSLVLIDEIGRGTSTYDGLSLAWSILEYLHTEIRAKILFATHFHEVTQLENVLPGVKNANVLVEKWKNEIVFLHRLGPGICNESYGIEVAKLAGLPPSLLSRAREILGVLETQSQRSSRSRGRALEAPGNQLAFFDVPKPGAHPPRTPLD